MMMKLFHRPLRTAGAIGAGMLFMYLFDPSRGRRRRAIAADKLRSARTHVEELARAASRDAANRGQGFVASMRSRLFEGEVPARTLEERVRSRIGRAISTPGAIEVSVADDGAVTLSGALLKGELNALLSAVWSVHGVRSVDDQLQLHEHAGNVSALQGAREPSAQQRSRRGNWPPSMRAVGGVAGVAATVIGFAYRPLGVVLTLAGSALLARSVSNRNLRQMAGLGGPESVHIRKDLYIAVPPQQVFEFWCRQENFPQFMRNVIEVRAIGAGTWHWKVAGPLGSSVEWDAEIVARKEGRHLAWRTLPGSSVEHRGHVDFEPEADGTRLRVSMDYTPAAGVFGHAVARLFGRDAKTEMDQDLMRMKSFLETGTPAHDAARAREDSSAEKRQRSVH